MILTSKQIFYIFKTDFLQYQCFRFVNKRELTTFFFDTFFILYAVLFIIGHAPFQYSLLNASVKYKVMETEVVEPYIFSLYLQKTYRFLLESKEKSVNMLEYRLESSSTELDH